MKKMTEEKRAELMAMSKDQLIAIIALLEDGMAVADHDCCHEPHKVFIGDKLRVINHDGTVEDAEE